MLRLAAVLVGLLLAAGCGSGGDGGDLVLDGSPRRPDDEGVATALDRESITLDGERTYDVSEQLRSFSTYTLEPEPMLRRRGQYVQVGLDGDTVVWMAGIASVVPVPDGEGVRRVYYSGVFEEVADGRWVFRDGTTFAVVEGLEAPPVGSRVQVAVDPGRHAVVELVSA